MVDMNTTGNYMTHKRFLNSNLEYQMTRHQTPQSSNISQIAYDAASGQLYVEFRNGRIYRYSEVSPDVWNQFIDADSAGQFFAARVKNAYASQIVTEIP